MKPALLVIDIQQAYFKESPVAAESLTNVIGIINYYIGMFRKYNLPVICVRNSEPDFGFVPGSDGYDVPESLEIEESDLHIDKTYGNAFNKTPLLEKLQELGVDTLFLTGFEAENCVLSTYRGALDLDLTPIIIRDTLASSHPENIPFVERIGSVISYAPLQKWLESLQTK
ncbi:MAG: isochorismatase family cysteine hydrolase [Anaerolineaceae bacterium]|nr:isochorismatase family cysteine hydrolase [Anaerolineaceae bacterium]